MKFSFAVLAFIAPMVLALPNAEPDMAAEQVGSTQPPEAGISGPGLIPLAPDEDKIKRSQPPGAGVSGSGPQPLNPSDEDKRSVLEARVDGKISSCKSTWVYKYGKHYGLYDYYGYDSAVDQFCQWVTTWGPGAQPAVIAPKTKFPGRITGWALLSHGLRPANIDFEIHNRQSKPYTVDLYTCTEALRKLSQPGLSCYGSGNQDTKGGTWQMPGDTVTFHAFNSQA